MKPLRTPSRTNEHSGTGLRRPRVQFLVLDPPLPGTDRRHGVRNGLTEIGTASAVICFLAVSFAVAITIPCIAQKLILRRSPRPLPDCEPS